MGVGVAAAPILASGGPQDVPATSSTATAIRHASLASPRRLIRTRVLRNIPAIGRLTNNARTSASPPPGGPGPAGGITAAGCPPNLGVGGGAAVDAAPTTPPGRAAPRGARRRAGVRGGR